MIKKLILLMATASLLTFSGSADTVIQIDTPNPGDTTTTITTNTTTSHTTDNLITQDFTDGSWEGTNQDSRHGSGTIAGIGGEYVESTITQSDIGLTDAQIQRGFTSTLGADIWFWDGTQDQSVTMTQSYDDKLGNVTTQNRVVDYDSSYYNTYTDTITVGTNLSTEGEATVRFDFTHTNTTSHRAADLKNPTLNIDYTNVVTSSTSTIEYCWEKTPPTCPAQEEIADVTDTIDEIFEDDIFEDDYSYEDTFIDTEYVEYEYDWNDDYFYDDVYEEEEYFEEETAYYLTDDFFFETEYYDEYESDYVEYDTDFELEEFDYELNEDYYEEEYSLAFNDIPIMEEYFEEDTYFEEEMYVEVFTDEAFIEEFDEMFEEMPMEEINMEMAEEMFEEMFEEYIDEEAPIEIVEEVIEEPIEEVIKKEEEPLEEVAMVEEEETLQQETIEETKDEQVEEQSSSESPIADEQEETADVTEQEETNEESTELAVVEGSPTEESDSVGETISDEPETNGELETALDIKIAALEKVIKNKISNEMQRVSITLDVINEIVSKEMISKEADISSYFNMNVGLFDTRQLPSGNMDFFNGHINLASYNKDIYSTQPSLASTDPVTQHEIKLIKAKDNTLKAYLKFKELLNARNGI